MSSYQYNTATAAQQQRIDPQLMQQILMQQQQQQQQMQTQLANMQQQANHPIGFGLGPDAQTAPVSAAQGQGYASVPQAPATVLPQGAPAPGQQYQQVTTQQYVPATPATDVAPPGVTAVTGADNPSNVGPGPPAPVVAPGALSFGQQQALSQAVQKMQSQMATPITDAPNFASTRTVLKPPELEKTIVFSVEATPNELDMLSSHDDGYFTIGLRNPHKARKLFRGKLVDLPHAFPTQNGERVGHLIKSVDIPCLSSEFPFALGATVAVATRDADGKWTDVNLCNQPLYDIQAREYGEILFPGNTKRFNIGKNLVYSNEIVKQGKSSNFWHIYTNKDALTTVGKDGMPAGITVVNPHSPPELQFCGVPLTSPICEFIWNGWKRYGMRLENRQIIHDVLPVPKCAVDDAIKLVSLITKKIPQHDLARLVLKINRIGQKSFAYAKKSIETRESRGEVALSESSRAQMKHEYDNYNRNIAAKNSKTYTAHIAVRACYTALEDHNRKPDDKDPKALTESIDMPTTAILMEHQQALSAHNYHAFERKIAEQQSRQLQTLAAGHQAYIPAQQAAVSQQMGYGH